MKETNIQKFKRLLSELFMFEYADLDFGIYRVMNAKRDEIRRFLDDDLLPQVRKEIEHLGTGKREDLLNQRAQIIQQLQDLQVPNPETNPKVLEIDEKLENTVDVTALENDIFSDLYDFFSRYYSDGDYMSLRRYKEGVYAIPYEGEEVKLHWANADQYYIKTSEYFRDYTFRLPDRRRVHFKLTSADTEQNNNKTNGNEKRVFILCEEDFIEEEDGDLVILFEYRLDLKKRKQSNLNDEAVERILAVSDFQSWMMILGRPAPTEKNADRCLLHKYLADYTSRNTFDYFIHKDLGGFLRRELDFFIKNEIMHLDDIESASAPRVERYLSKIKALRRVAHKVIDFLEQLENFQKKLWLKKKFVIETNYCITLDRIPDELYPEIIANDLQRDKWIELFAIDEINGDLLNERYTEPVSMDFLEQNQYLLVDTQFFSDSFKYKLLSAFDNLDDEIDGILISSENFQALNLIEERYRNSIDCIYIDPPYNTGSDGFVYKDTYQHSSWGSMLHDRLSLAKKLLQKSGIIASSIDDNEVHYLGMIFESLFGKSNRLACAPWQSEPSGGKEKTGLRSGHEYLQIYHNGDISQISQDEKSTGKLNLQDSVGKYRKGRELRKWGGVSDRSDRPKQFYALPAPDGTEAYPIKNDGTEGHWRWGLNNSNIQIAIKDTNFFHWEKTPYDTDIKVDGETHRWTPYEKIRNTKKSIGWSTWLDSHGINADATRTLKELFGYKAFDTPKPVQLVEWYCNLHGDENGIALDFFAGSGVLGHAVIDLNRDSGERRRYILVEMGDYFDNVLKPRILKAVYSSEWKDGKPVNREGISQLIKYIRLESYEDTLNNLELKRTSQQQKLLDEFIEFREEYLLKYLLDVESKNSESLTNFRLFKNPFEYLMHIQVEVDDTPNPRRIDLVETFNYLLGIHVRRIQSFDHIRVVEGQNRDDQNVLIIWRNQEEIDNEELDTFFLEMGGLEADFDLIYVNGDNHLENLKTGNEAWQVRLIEPTFHDLMFDVQDV